MLYNYYNILTISIIFSVHLSRDVVRGSIGGFKKHERKQPVNVNSAHRRSQLVTWDRPGRASCKFSPHHYFRRCVCRCLLANLLMVWPVIAWGFFSGAHTRVYRTQCRWTLRQSNRPGWSSTHRRRISGIPVEIITKITALFFFFF